MARKKTKPNPDSPEFFPGDRLIRQIAQALDERKIPYIVIGGQAVIQHGHRRLTLDVDFTVYQDPWDISPILATAKATQLTTEIPDPSIWTRQTHVLPFFHTAADLGVDFSFVTSPYMEQAIARGVHFNIAGYRVRFLALEDLVLQKVIANRPQDRIDVVELLARHLKADHDYIRRWLKQFEEIVEERLVERFDELLHDSTR